jgi:hypothetical protein
LEFKIEEDFSFPRRHCDLMPRIPPAARHADLEAGGRAECRSCKKGRYEPPVHMIKLTETREITPYRWVHPDEDR